MRSSSTICDNWMADETNAAADATKARVGASRAHSARVGRVRRNRRRARLCKGALVWTASRSVHRSQGKRSRSLIRTLAASAAASAGRAVRPVASHGKMRDRPCEKRRRSMAR